MPITGFFPLKSVRGALLCSAFATSAIIPVQSFAQDQNGACLQLQQVAEQIDFEQSGISQDQYVQVVEGNDAGQCRVLLTEVNAAMGLEGEVSETEQARVRLSDEVVIEGRAIIDQGPASVQIEEQATEVIVGESTPDVNVTQEAFDIVVLQDAPRITLDMPQPTITIEQPAPEFIITMPDPSVDVANTRPQVEVRQGQPRVTVNVPEPTVELDIYQAEDPENSPGIAISRREAADGTVATAEPEVSMTRSEAQVVYQDSGQQQPNVSISRAEPNIRFEQGEPQIEIRSSGEPQVNWSQSGEPVVRFEDSTAGGQQQDAAATEQQDPALQNDQSNQQAMTGGPNVRREGYEMIDVSEVSATELDGAPVFGVQGNEVSEIGTLTVAEGDAQSVIVDVGAFTGAEQREVRVPLSDLTILHDAQGGDLRTYINASEVRLMSYPEVD
ncbi:MULTISPECIES: hypothetical protein [unclassified Yoonia]|uniref:hypothetical protein n=1 Tax=unclassified Yoonia TaxID=2629118 RepID=UPI002B003E16|nr:MULTISPECIES: hypothetical protein [unclassified Yoonia]